MKPYRGRKLQKYIVLKFPPIWFAINHIFDMSRVCHVVVLGPGAWLDSKLALSSQATTSQLNVPRGPTFQSPPLLIWFPCTKSRGRSRWRFYFRWSLFPRFFSCLLFCCFFFLLLFLTIIEFGAQCGPLRDRIRMICLLRNLRAS